MGGENFGRDLVGVQNLLKKHSRLESELASHQRRLEVGRPPFVSYNDPESSSPTQAVLAGGEGLGVEVTSAAHTVSDRCSQISRLWEELTQSTHIRLVHTQPLPPATNLPLPLSSLSGGRNWSSLGCTRSSRQRWMKRRHG